MNKKTIVPWACASFSMLCIAAACILMAMPAQAASPDLAFYGSPAEVRMHRKTITITPTTRYINVTSGEMVNFIVGDKEFAWHFDVSMNIFVFDLTRIAPPNLLGYQIKVYVAPNPESIF